MLTVLLARIAAGAAWAMPPVIDMPLPASHSVSAANMPCHMVASATDAESSTAQNATAQPASGHTGCGHCALCFPALTMAVHLPVTVAVFSAPTTPAKTSSHWQPAPDLRPPI
ncbi:hypothetical protein [Candidatus Aalborgicola defluviihabitans]|uniref:hypothetical protein n=1 Tax=Candidatus Aalborgicola defluviihabitans TaxID=3386187 RepID=UPI001E07F68B|nr:hypothetical protein [Burkholderiales bacterium]MBK7312369.1 hypothetical protein [Burkholderiales bacterium]